MKFEPSAPQRELVLAMLANLKQLKSQSAEQLFKKLSNTYGMIFHRGEWQLVEPLSEDRK